MGITHATTATGTDAGTGEIHKAQWNADHTGADFALLEQHTASSSATLDFTTFISSTYDVYQFECVTMIPATNAVAWIMRIGTGGGPTYDSGSNYFNPANETGYNMGTVANAAGYGQISATMRLVSPQSTTQMKQFFGTANYHNGTNALTGAVGGLWAVTTAVTAVRFLFSSGNIASGTIRVYGIGK